MSSRKKGASFLKVMWQICFGVADIHAHKKIHRDLKPDNLRFDKEGTPKYLYFGLSVDSEDAETLRSRGSFYYAAPELLVSLLSKLPRRWICIPWESIAWFVASYGTLPAFLWDLKRKTQKDRNRILKRCAELIARVDLRIDRCLDTEPKGRPTAVEVRVSLAKELLRGKISGAGDFEYWLS